VVVAVVQVLVVVAAQVDTKQEALLQLLEHPIQQQSAVAVVVHQITLFAVITVATLLSIH
jgi:hypothetical protein